MKQKNSDLIAKAVANLISTAVVWGVIFLMFFHLGPLLIERYVDSWERAKIEHGLE